MYLSPISCRAKHTIESPHSHPTLESRAISPGHRGEGGGLGSPGTSVARNERAHEQLSWWAPQAGRAGCSALLREGVEEQGLGFRVGSGLQDTEATS